MPAPVKKKMWRVQFLKVPQDKMPPTYMKAATKEQVQAMVNRRYPGNKVKITDITAEHEQVVAKIKEKERAQSRKKEPDPEPEPTGPVTLNGQVIGEDEEEEFSQ